MRPIHACALAIMTAATLLCLRPAPAAAQQPAEPAEPVVYDLVIYGPTSAGIIAAQQATIDGLSVVVVGPDTHLGGLSAGGLGWTDSGKKHVIGGLSRGFYQRIYQHYQDQDAWTFQTPEHYGNRGQGTPAIDGDNRTMWIFEPHAAEGVFEDIVKEHDIPVYRDHWLDREDGVAMDGQRITSITMLNGKTFHGKMFIDATYEGDLMAAAGVSYTVGRESNDTYNETLNGNQPGRRSHQFTTDVDPYVVPGDPTSGLLPRIQQGGTGEKGEGDHRVQAYCFRMCMTNVPENRVPFPKPEGYDVKQYELLLRAIQAHGPGYVFGKFDPIPNGKTDTNNHGPFSTDNIGMNWDYPEASYQRRAEIIDEHRTYQQGYHYFLCNDPRVPEDVRERYSQWGLAKDEFTDNGNWPHQLYIREARRMVGDFVVSENHLTLKIDTPRPIGMGSYNMDSHNVRRYVDEDGHVRNEGDVQVGLRAPYPIDYGAIVPKAGECENLFVPVCVSASHIAFGSIRMEPVFMILGQSAAQAAKLALELDLPVQDVPYDRLAQALKDAGQVLGEQPVELGNLGMDDTQAKLTGNWQTSTSVGNYIGQAYRHDNNANKGEMSARFTIAVPEPGRYEVRLAYTPEPNRATNVPVAITHRDGTEELTINQQTPPPINQQFTSLGVFDFQDAATVHISNTNTNGYVILDAVQLIPTPD